MEYLFKGPLTLEELDTLLQSHSWNMPLERLEETMRLSWGWITARSEEGDLAGFVQVLSDGYRHAYIMRLIVHPDFRRQGIGSAIMEELMRILRQNRLLPTLVSTPGNDAFYRKFGFTEDSHGYKAMCIRNG
ncbi:Acetyltransferase (GNAT) family protein [compost metagenome]